MANFIYINAAGVIVPDTSTILQGVQDEFRNSFGADLVVTPDTPQGVLITAEALARDAVVRINAMLANQINPNLAGGIFLDAICALTMLFRAQATRSTVTATLTGVATTIIPAGVRAQTAAGDQFELTSTATLDGSGNATGLFQSVEFGPIAAGPGDLTQIVDSVLGWETITNPAAATLGQVEQSDVALRALRKNTLAIQGVSLPYAISSAVYDVEGVKSLTFRENVAATTQVIDGVTMVAYSIYVCVDGGTDEDVAQALLANKSLGAAWNNGESSFPVSESVIDPVSGQTYTVEFDRPDEIAVLIRAYVKTNSVSIDAQTAVRDAIMAYVNGELEGESGFTVGTSVSAFELAGAINRAVPGIYVQLLQTTLASNPSGWATTELPITLWEKATTNPSAITVNLV